MIDREMEMHDSLDNAIRGVIEMRAETERLRRALEEIAVQCERLAAAGEPQNYVPEFCRAILAGHDVTLAAMDAWLGV